MKELRELTEEQARHICEISNEPFLSFLTNNHGKWNTLGIEVNIYTTSTAEGSRDDSNISIYKNGKIVLWRTSWKYKSNGNRRIL